MSMFAIIQDATIVQLFEYEGDLNDLLTPDIQWADVTATDPMPEEGWGAVATGGAWVFTAPVVPPPTWDQVLAARIAEGIAITSTSTPSLATSMAIDSLTMDQIGSVARDFSSGLGLPGDAETFTYPDAGGTPRTFNGEQIMALYRKQRNLLSVLNMQAAVMRQGGLPSWPVQSAVLP